MSAGAVTGVALLGALAGWLAVPLAGRYLPRASTPATSLVPPSPSPSPSVPVPSPSPSVPVPSSSAVGAAVRTGGPGRTPGRVTLTAVGAVVFGGLAAARDGDPALPAYLLVGAIGLVLALVDLACLRLPDPLVALAAGCGALGVFVAALVTGAAGGLLAALAGAALSFGCYALLAVLPGSRLGFGDVKLAAALGLPLGWLGWSALGLGLILPHLLNGVVVLALLATRRVRRDTALPFGPAILVGAWLAVLLA
ncbi:A24 family peptidase [Micromonospora sp. HK10]|uniref:prepilin peptidase n=1 Tax=Micromonospora sp. HK10 TaxID=1538294 RepID=UPI000A4ABE5B|nr:A24 family peptidase [Micromonospora sp. HK10]